MFNQRDIGGPGRLQMATEYLDLCRLYPPEKGGQGSGMKCIKAHLHRFLHADLQHHTVTRDMIIKAYSIEAMDEVVDMVRRIHDETGHDVNDEQLSWYVRHRSGCGEDGEAGQVRGEEEEQEHAAVEEEKKKDSTPEEEEECHFGDMFGGEVCAADGDY